MKIKKFKPINFLWQMMMFLAVMMFTFVAVLFAETDLGVFVVLIVGMFGMLAIGEINDKDLDEKK